jgi:ribose transport system permease protein
MTTASLNPVRFASRAAVPLLLAAVLILSITLVDPRFVTAQNLINVARGASLLLIVASGQMLVMIVGGLDLSIGACMALCSVICSLVMVWIGAVFPDEPFIAVIGGAGAALGCGLMIGLINGICVARLKIPPLIVTLGMMSVASGFALMLTNGVPVYGLPDMFIERIGRTLPAGLPNAVWVAALIVLTLVALQRHSSHGPRLLATGDNLYSARVSGIAVDRYVVAAYVCSSMFAATASLLLTAQIGSGQSSIGDRLALESIAAAVIGGVSIRGGSGQPEHVAAGTFFLFILNNVMDLLEVNSRMQMVLLGLFVVLVAGLGVARARRRHAGH